jgi:hypothetical protein
VGEAENMHFSTATTLEGKARSMGWCKNKFKDEVCGSGGSKY